MIKQLLLTMCCALSSVFAMELDEYKQPDTNVCRFSLRKTVQLMLGNKPCIIWPTEAGRLDLFERSIAGKLYKGVIDHPLFTKGAEVIGHASTEEQLFYFNTLLNAISCDPEKLHPMGRICAKDTIECVILSIALYAQSSNPGKGTSGIWDKLCSAKTYIDNSEFGQEITYRDKLFMCSLFKKAAWHYGCQDRVACQECLPKISNYISQKVVHTCCQDTVNLGKVCNYCDNLLKRSLYIQVKMLVFGLHHFGVTMENNNHKALAQWADIMLS